MNHNEFSYNTSSKAYLKKMQYTIQKFGVIFSYVFEASYAHQGCIYFIIINKVKTAIL